jgi:hypothetical protein
MTVRYVRYVRSDYDDNWTLRASGPTLNDSLSEMVEKKAYVYEGHMVF